jgi:hypothetical protein
MRPQIDQFTTRSQRRRLGVPDAISHEHQKNADVLARAQRAPRSPAA